MNDITFARAKVVRRRHPAEAQCTRSLGLAYKLCAVIPVAGPRMHGTTFRALEVISQVSTTGTESAVHDCLVTDCIFLFFVYLHITFPFP